MPLLAVAVLLGVALSRAAPAAALAGLTNLDVRASLFAGLWPALVTVILSEFGDKTFFVAMILSIKRGRARALSASLTALFTMTAISTILGVAVSSFPAVLQGGEAAVQTLGALLFAFFGVSSLLQARTARQVAQEERHEADEEVTETLEKKATDDGSWQEWWQCVFLVFVAEWGDRSMVAQVALAATWNPIGVILGGLAGHALATGCAVYGGEVLQRYIDDVTAKVAGGVLFLVFAVTTLIGIY